MSPAFQIFQLYMYIWLFCYLAVPLGIIIVLGDADLETVREQINRLGKEMLVTTNNNTNSDSQTTGEAEAPPPPSIQPLSPKWCFLDCKYIYTVRTETFYSYQSCLYNPNKYI